VQSLVLLAFALGLGPGDGGYVEDFEGPSAEGWERVASEPYPPYNTVERIGDPEEAKSGSRFLRFQTQGGPTAVRRSALQPWAIEAGRPYRLSVWTRLSRTKRNSASLSVTWVGPGGNPLLDQRSPAVDKTEGWTLLSIDLFQTPPGAAGILPCLNFEGDDVRGACDFDLLRLVPVERLDLKPVGRSWPVFSPEEYPRYSLTLAGLPDGVHSVTAVVRPAEGPEIRRSITVQVPADQPSMLDFPPLPIGSHELAASVDGRDARQSTALIVAPPGFTLQADADPKEATPFSTAEAALRSRILNPSLPVALSPHFLCPADGRPTRALYPLRITDDLRRNAVPIPDPGLFPAPVKVAAFRKEASVLLALWCDEGEAEVVAGLHEGVKIQPPFEARRALLPGERVRIGTFPVFLLDLDPLWTELRFTLSQSELPLQRSPVKLTARLENRSRAETPRDVTVTLETAPAGWRIAPRRFKTEALAPDAAHSEDLEIALPPSESERVQDLRFEVRFAIQGLEHVMHVVRPLRLKSAIGIETAVAEGATAGSKKLTVRILNGSERPMTVSIRARVPGLPERTELVRELGAGGRSTAFEYVVQDPKGDAEIVVQESGADRASARKSVPLR
jgi:hypothetical protein